MISALFLVLFSLQYEVAQAQDGATWADSIDVAGKQRMLSQRMTKEFLLVCAGMNVEANVVQLGKTMKEFDGSLQDLIHGNAARKIKASPNTVTSGRLQVVVGVWAEFSQVINTNLDAAKSFNGSVDMSVMAKILDPNTGNIKLLKTSNAVVGALVDAAKAAGASVSGLTVDIAGRQRMLIQRMCKESLLIVLGVNVESNAKALKGSIKLFDTSHSGIILGVEFAGIPALRSMCTLYQMREVSYHWDLFQPLVDSIITPEESAAKTQVAKQTIPDVIETAGNLKKGLFSAMVESVKLYVAPSTACDPLTDVNPDGQKGINSQGWTYLLNNVGKQRMLSQKASQLYTQIANSIAVEQAKVELIINVDLNQRSIRSLIEGSRALNIFAPPTQQILDQLLAAYSSWSEMKAGLEDGISLNPDQFTEAQVGLVARMSEKVLFELNSAVQLYEDACVSVNSTVPARLINDAGRQRMVLMKMGKEAGLVQYGYEREANWQLLNETRAFFDGVHWMLLYGDTEKPGIPPTTDICIIQQLKVAYDLYLELDAAVLRIARGAKLDLWASTGGRKGLLQEAFSAMHAAVLMYAKGASSCEPLAVSAQEWAGVIRGADKIQGLAERAAAEYFLSQGEKTQVDSGALPAVLADLEASIKTIRFGSGVANVPAPLNQENSDDLSKLDGEFAALSQAFATSNNNAVPARTDDISKHAKSLIDFYEGRAGESKTGKQLQMARLRKVSQQAVLVQTSLRYAAQARLMGGEALYSFQSTLTSFEDSHNQLLNGGGSVHAVIEERPDLQEQWEAMDRAWLAFKPLVENFAEPQAWSSQTAMFEAAGTLLDEIDRAIPLFSQADPHVPPKPPPFPYTQIIYAITGTLLVLTMCSVSVYFYRQASGENKKTENTFDVSATRSTYGNSNRGFSV